MSKTEHRERLSAAAKVARVADLSDVRMCSTRAERYAPVDEICSSVCMLSVSNEHSFAFDEKAVVLHSYVDTTVVLSRAPRDADGEQPSAVQKSDDQQEFVRIGVRFELSYELPSAPPEKLRDELFSAFSELNATYNAWPYIRETVQSLATRMGLPPLILPLFKVDGTSDDENPAPKLRVVGAKD